MLKDWALNKTKTMNNPVSHNSNISTNSNYWKLDMLNYAKLAMIIQLIIKMTHFREQNPCGRPTPRQNERYKNLD